MVSRNGNRLLTNERAEELLGAIPVDGIRGLFLDVTGLDGQPFKPEDRFFTRVLRGETISHEEVVYHRADGRSLRLRLSAVPMRRADQSIDAMLLVAEDVSTEVELNRMREEWNSLIAHDLRQPVAAIALQAQHLMAASTEQVARQEAEKILQRTARLERMIRDLLDDSLLSASRLTLEARPLELEALARAVVEAVADPTVVVHAEGTIPKVLADPARLEQVLGNLISNARKYRAPGTPVRVELLAGTKQVQVSVVNEGPGIPTEDQPRVFERYYRTEAARAYTGGLGLGLYVARGLVEAQGGRIWVESLPGRTTAFRFTVPRAPAEPDQAR
jgi:PAS domain S-box-containing protein